MAHIRIPVDSHHQLIANTIETVQDNVSLALGCIQAQLWVQYMTAAITWEVKTVPCPLRFPLSAPFPLRVGCHSGLHHLHTSSTVRCPIAARDPLWLKPSAQQPFSSAPALLVQLKRGCTLGSGSVTAPLQGLAVPSLFLAHWWKSHAHQVLAPWISQHPQTSRVGPCSPLHPAELGRWVPAPATSQGVTRVPWPR